MWVNIALRRILHIKALSRQKEARKSRNYALVLFRMTSRVLYSAQYDTQHCALHEFEQFGALYMHNHDDKYAAWQGREPGTPRLQAPVDTNEPPGPASHLNVKAGIAVTIFHGIIGCFFLTQKTQATAPMLAHRLRRWPNIYPALGQCPVCVGIWHIEVSWVESSSEDWLK